MDFDPVRRDARLSVQQIEHRDTGDVDDDRPARRGVNDEGGSPGEPVPLIVTLSLSKGAPRSCLTAGIVAQCFDRLSMTMP
jgi:hypothetical protein